MSTFPIQSAIYTALSGSAALISLGVEVTDFGPRPNDGAQPYPYVAIGSIILAEMDTKTSNGFDAAIRIHTHSNSGSAKQCREIQDAIYTALHRVDLTVSGFNAIQVYRVDSDITQAATGAFHGVCEYRALFDAT